MAKNIIIRDVAMVKRDFKYKLGNVELSFNLRIDIKKDCKDFLELLNMAVRDLEDQIKDIKKHE